MRVRCRMASPPPHGYTSPPLSPALGTDRALDAQGAVRACECVEQYVLTLPAPALPAARWRGAARYGVEPHTDRAAARLRFPATLFLRVAVF